MAYFLHYAPHSDFEQGIFVPYGTQLEAERQAAADLLEGDPDFIMGIFEAEYALPKFGWLKSDVDARRNASPMWESELMPHLDPEKRKKLMSTSQIVKGAKKHQRDMLEESVRALEDHMLALQKAITDGSAFKNAVPGNGYSVMTGGTATAGAMALAAATAKTAVAVIAGSTTAPALSELSISFDGVTASAVPVLVELCESTQAGAGTTTAQTPIQTRGWPPSASVSSAAQTYTAEPTVLTVARKWLLSPNGGLMVVQFPMGKEPTGLITASAAGKAWAVRLTAPAIVNVHVTVEFDE